MNSQQSAETFDSVLEAMSDVQRRKLLVALLEHNPQDDSPVVVADDESESEVIERFLTMRHVHLPKLEANGFIEWDQDADEVHTGPAFEEIRPLLELLVEHEGELPDDWI